jgi:hypothetical protein
VRKGGGTNAWAGAALAIGAGFVSRECFAAWFQAFAQPAAEAKRGISDLLAKASDLEDWDTLLISPFPAARFALAWTSALPGSPKLPAPAFPWAAEESAARAEAQAARARAEAVRKGAKALRDRFCARLSGLGLSVAGLPKEPRAALDALDQNLPWTRKLEAQVEFEAFLLRQAAKAGPAKAPQGKTVSAKTQGAADSAQAGQDREDQRLKDLSGRFRKLR